MVQFTQQQLGGLSPVQRRQAQAEEEAFMRQQRAAAELYYKQLAEQQTVATPSYSTTSTTSKTSSKSSSSSSSGGSVASDTYLDTFAVDKLNQLIPALTEKQLDEAMKSTSELKSVLEQTPGFESVAKDKNVLERIQYYYKNEWLPRDVISDLQRQNIPNATITKILQKPETAASWDKRLTDASTVKAVQNYFVTPTPTKSGGSASPQSKSTSRYIQPLTEADYASFARADAKANAKPLPVQPTAVQTIRLGSSPSSTISRVAKGVVSSAVSTVSKLFGKKYIGLDGKEYTYRKSKNKKLNEKIGEFADSIDIVDDPFSVVGGVEGAEYQKSRIVAGNSDNVNAISHELGHYAEDAWQLFKNKKPVKISDKLSEEQYFKKLKDYAKKNKLPGTDSDEYIDYLTKKKVGNHYVVTHIDPKERKALLNSPAFKKDFVKEAYPVYESTDEAIADNFNRFLRNPDKYTKENPQFGKRFKKFLLNNNFQKKERKDSDGGYDPFGISGNDYLPPVNFGDKYSAAEYVPSTLSASFQPGSTVVSNFVPAFSPMNQRLRESKEKKLEEQGTRGVPNPTLKNLPPTNMGDRQVSSASVLPFPVQQSNLPFLNQQPTSTDIIRAGQTAAQKAQQELQKTIAAGGGSTTTSVITVPASVIRKYSGGSGGVSVSIQPLPVSAAAQTPAVSMPTQVVNPVNQLASSAQALASSAQSLAPNVLAIPSVVAALATGATTAAATRLLTPEQRQQALNTLATGAENIGYVPSVASSYIQQPYFTQIGEKTYKETAGLKTILPGTRLRYVKELELKKDYEPSYEAALKEIAPLAKSTTESIYKISSAQLTLSGLEEKYNQEVSKLEKKYTNDEISFNDYNKGITSLTDKYNQKISNENKNIEALTKLTNEKIETIQKIESEPGYQNYVKLIEQTGEFATPLERLGPSPSVAAKLGLTLATAGEALSYFTPVGRLITSGAQFTEGAKDLAKGRYVSGVLNVGAGGLTVGLEPAMKAVSAGGFLAKAGTKYFPTVAEFASKPLVYNTGGKVLLRTGQAVATGLGIGLTGLAGASSYEQTAALNPALAPYALAGTLGGIGLGIGGERLVGEIKALSPNKASAREAALEAGILRRGRPTEIKSGTVVGEGKELSKSFKDELIPGGFSSEFARTVEFPRRMAPVNTALREFFGLSKLGSTTYNAPSTARQVGRVVLDESGKVVSEILTPFSPSPLTTEVFGGTPPSVARTPVSYAFTQTKEGAPITQYLLGGQSKIYTAEDFLKILSRSDLSKNDRAVVKALFEKAQMKGGQLLSLPEEALGAIGKVQTEEIGTLSRVKGGDSYIASQLKSKVFKPIDVGIVTNGKGTFYLKTEGGWVKYKSLVLQNLSKARLIEEISKIKSKAVTPSSVKVEMTNLVSIGDVPKTTTFDVPTGLKFKFPKMIKAKEDITAMSISKKITTPEGTPEITGYKVVSYKTPPVEKAPEVRKIIRVKGVNINEAEVSSGGGADSVFKENSAGLPTDKIAKASEFQDIIQTQKLLNKLSPSVRNELSELNIAPASSATPQAQIPQSSMNMAKYQLAARTAVAGLSVGKREVAKMPAVALRNLGLAKETGIVTAAFIPSQFTAPSSTQDSLTSQGSLPSSFVRPVFAQDVQTVDIKPKEMFREGITTRVIPLTRATEITRATETQRSLGRERAIEQPRPQELVREQEQLRELQRSLQLQRANQLQRPQQKFRPLERPLQMPKPELQPRPPAIPREPIRPRGFGLPTGGVNGKSKKGVKYVEGYGVEVRRRKKFAPVTQYSYPKEEAFAIGVKQTLGGAAATFRLKKTKAPFRETGMRVSSREASRFYATKSPDTFVQRKTLRITTPGEVREISLVGAAARRRGSILKKGGVFR